MRLSLVGLMAFAKNKTLVVDNKLPIWFSSKNGYTDQQSVENLKVTGYINEEDLKFRCIEKKQFEALMMLHHIENRIKTNNSI